MIELAVLLLSAFILFMFGISVISLSVIGLILVLSFILISTISFVFKFGIWILLAIGLYYYFSKKDGTKNEITKISIINQHTTHNECC